MSTNHGAEAKHRKQPSTNQEEDCKFDWSLATNSSALSADVSLSPANKIAAYISKTNSSAASADVSLSPANYDLNIFEEPDETFCVNSIKQTGIRLGFAKKNLYFLGQRTKSLSNLNP